jgi:hypothetical protein
MAPQSAPTQPAWIRIQQVPSNKTLSLQDTTSHIISFSSGPFYTYPSITPPTASEAEMRLKSTGSATALLLVVASLASAQSVNVLPTVGATVRTSESNTSGSLEVGDIVSSHTVEIGSHEYSANRVVAKVLGNRHYEYRVEWIKNPPLHDKETPNNACLLYAFERYVADPTKVSHGCSGVFWANNRYRTEASIRENMGGFRTIGAASLAFSGNEAGLYSEIASDNVWLGGIFNHARLVFGALVSSSPDDTSSTSSAPQLYQGGGNATVNLIIPIGYWTNFVQPFVNDELRFIRRLDFYWTNAVGADVPDMGGGVENPAMNVRTALQSTFVQSTLGDIFRLFATGEVSAGLGSDNFFRNIEPDDDVSGRGFAFLRGEMGLEVGKLFRIGMETGVATMGPRLQPRLTLRLIPAQD